MAGFASWLFGLPVQQPREYRRLMRIRSRVYTPIARLDAEILRSAEPIPFDQLDRTAFVPLRPGTHWGKVFDCAWLHITGDVPAGVDHPVVMLGIRGEGLVHSADGELLDSVSTVFQQGDLPNSGGRYRPVLNVDTSSREDRVLRRRHLQRVDPLRGGPCRLPRRPSRDPRRRGLRPLLRLPHPARAGRGDRGCRARIRAAAIPPQRLRALHEGRSRRRASGPRRAAVSALDERIRLQRRRARPPRHGLAVAAPGDAAQGRAHLRSRPQRDRPTRRLHLRHLPAAADGVDEAAASGALRADAGAPSPRGAWSCRARSGWSPTRTCRRGSRSCGRPSSVVASSRRSSGSPTTSCGSAGSPTPSATTATCRRSSAGTGMDWFQTIKLAVEQGQRLPAPQLPLAGHRRIDRAGAHASRGRLQQPRRGRQPAHGPQTVSRTRT